MLPYDWVAARNPVASVSKNHNVAVAGEQPQDRGSPTKLPQVISVRICDRGM